MRQVLYPKYLIGGVLQRGGGGIGAAERGEASGFGGGVRNALGRWPDADVVLQGGMSEGLRDWDLWWVAFQVLPRTGLSADDSGARLSSACF